MGLFDKLRGEFVDIIEWLDDSSDTIVYRFQRYNNEIKDNAQLIVRESQVAVFVDQGRVADVFVPGRYTLNTDNLPILTTLRGWKFGFESAYKAEVYFVNTRTFTDQKWGTKNPIMLRDPEFGPLRIRAFGTYTFKVDNATKFIEEIVGTDGHFKVEEISDQLRNFIITRFTNTVANSKIPVLDLAANYDQLSAWIEDKIRPEFATYGLLVNKFLVENISLPEEVEKVLDKRTSMGIVGDLSKYTQFQTADAIRESAENGGTGNTIVGMGMGYGMMDQMMQAQTQMNQQQQQDRSVTPPPPPLPPQIEIFVAQNGQQTGPFDLTTVTQMVKNGAINRDTLVWKTGMAAWQPAADVAELSAIFSQIPPPLV